MIILTLTSFVAMVLYLVLFSRKFGLPWSLSETYYTLRNRCKHGGWKFLFPAVMWLCAFTLMPAWIEASPDNLRALAFFGTAGLVFVGGTPCFTEKVQGKVHIIATVVSGLCSIVWACLAGLWFVPLAAILGCAVPVVRTRKRLLFWLEIALLASTYVSVFIELFR